MDGVIYMTGEGQGVSNLINILIQVDMTTVLEMKYIPGLMRTG